VTTKADSKFKIVGAASVAAKVTRDACVDDWIFEEDDGKSSSTWSKELGCGYPSGLLRFPLTGNFFTCSAALQTQKHKPG